MFIKKSFQKVKNEKIDFGRIYRSIQMGNKTSHQSERFDIV